ncbi:sugar ABC transporter ATP-binding protein, partial [Rhizobium ruizarguesonis]
AMTMADRFVVMNGGIIEQAGPPQALYHRPFSQFVACFIGSPSMNFLSATLLSGEKDLVVKLTDGSELGQRLVEEKDFRISHD